MIRIIQSLILVLTLSLGFCSCEGKGKEAAKIRVVNLEGVPIEGVVLTVSYNSSRRFEEYVTNRDGVVVLSRTNMDSYYSVMFSVPLKKDKRFTLIFNRSEALKFPLEVTIPLEGEKIKEMNP